MKKIYLSILSMAFAAQISTAQTLTQAANQPTVGDSFTNKGWDSTGVVPKSGGTNQMWNFAPFNLNTTTLTSTYQSTTAVPGSSVFPGATIVENLGGGEYNYYTSAGSNFELMGNESGLGTYNYTNTALIAQWPIAMGYSVTDNYSGTLSGSASGNLTGTITTQGFGTGSLTLPGGMMLSNVLLVKTWNRVAVTLTFPPVTATVTGTDYYFYHSSQKFPVVRVMYSATTGFTNTSSATIDMNLAVVTGINDMNFDATFEIFPNPAKDYFNVTLSNAANENTSVMIYNNLGQLVKNENLGNTNIVQASISIRDLAPGIYTVKTNLGNKTSSRKLIVQ